MSEQNKMQGTLEVVSMSELSSPPIIEITTKDFVLNGERNEYFDFLIEMYNASATWGAAIDEICRLIYGKGLAIVTEEGEVVENDMSKKINDLITAKDLVRFVKDRVMMSNAALQIVYQGIGNRKQVAEIKHFPVQTLAPKLMGMKGEVEAYYYHPNWKKYKEGDKLKKIPAFGYGDNIEIYVCKPYCPGHFYWSPLQSSGGLDYSLLECEIAKYQVNDIKNGFSGTTLFNIQRNVENQDKLDLMVGEMRDRVSGSTGDKNLFSFNSTPEEKMEITAFPVNDAPQRYEQLAQEASRKILTAWGIPNPKLIGVPAYGEGGGFGNNAKEIEVAFDMFYGKVIVPYKDEILEGIKEILSINKIEEELDFVKITPIDFDKFYEREENEMKAKHNAKAEAKTMNAVKDKDKGKARNKAKENKSSEQKGDKK